MESAGTIRLVGAAAVATAGIAAALLFGTSLSGGLAALLAGAIAVLVLRGPGLEATPLEPPVATTGLPPLPSASDLIEAVDEPLLIVRNRKVLLANSAARAILGAHIEGADVRLAIRHPAAAQILGEPEGADQPGDSSRTELVGLGELDRRWEMTTARLKDGSRLVRLTDRSEVHATEQMRVDFVANASHELRTPLATLIGFLETLQDETAAEDRDTRSRFLRIMHDEARRMQQLVEDLISLSRIEAERFTVPRDAIDVLPLVEEVRTGCRQLMEERKNRIVVRNIASATRVLGDRPQLLQLLRNLIVNALKYGRPGNDIEVIFEDAGADMLHLTVTDHGEGIAPEHLPRLTERFYRVDAGRSRAVGGTGLGLAIVKHIVGRHRGRLDIRSRPGEGTSVHVLLPRPEPVSSKSHTSVTGVSSTGHSAPPDADQA